jgi:hypothetical protein
MAYEFNTIDEAIEAIRTGEVLIVVDDEDRENEGDFVCAAELITPEIVNFMVSRGRGMVCVPITEQRMNELQLGMMVDGNTVRTLPLPSITFMGRPPVSRLLTVRRLSVHSPIRPHCRLTLRAPDIFSHSRPWTAVYCVAPGIRKPLSISPVSRGCSR